MIPRQRLKAVKPPLGWGEASPPSVPLRSLRAPALEISFKKTWKLQFKIDFLSFKSALYFIYFICSIRSSTVYSHSAVEVCPEGQSCPRRLFGPLMRAMCLEEKHSGSNDSDMLTLTTRFHTPSSVHREDAPSHLTPDHNPIEPWRKRQTSSIYSLFKAPTMTFRWDLAFVMILMLESKWNERKRLMFEFGLIWTW